MGWQPYVLAFSDKKWEETPSTILNNIYVYMQGVPENKKMLSIHLKIEVKNKWMNNI